VPPGLKLGRACAYPVFVGNCLPARAAALADPANSACCLQFSELSEHFYAVPTRLLGDGGRAEPAVL
jgi:hypothetical protein